jgi:Lrp/AsnC family leucine-responsive transcriptional regulator
MRKTTPQPLDQFDRKILVLVQEDNLVPQRIIADKVGLSVAAVARRLKQLRVSGTIRKNISVLDEAAVGRPLTIIIQVSTESERLDLLDGMKARFANCKQVRQCYYVTGATDFVLVLSVRDMTEYNEISRSLFFDGGNVKSFVTAVVMENVKLQGALPVD